MGGNISSRHGKPCNKTTSNPKTSPTKNSPTKNHTVVTRKNSPCLISTPCPVKPTDPLLPIQIKIPPVQDSNQDRPKTSIQAPSTSIQPPLTSIPPPRSSIKDPITSIQPPRTSIQDPGTSNKGPITSIQDPSASNQETKTNLPDPNESEWKNYTETDLHGLLISKLDRAYNEALSRLIALGYDKPTAVRAVLSSGHCQGHFDLLTNILKNSIKYLTYPNEKAVTFCSLKQLEENSLNDLVSSVQKLRLDFNRPDAMRYLLAHELHVGETAGTKLVQAIPNGTGLFKPIPSSLNNAPPELEQGSDNNGNSLEEDSEEETEIDMDTLHDAMHVIYELGVKASKNKLWAQKKALQAAMKVSNDSMELRTLHMEKEHGERLQKEQGERIVEMERQVVELEKEVRRITEELERSNMEMRQLEMEGKEVRAELEAARLNGAEASKNYKRIEKKVKRIEKNCEGLEKQKVELRDELSQVKRKRKAAQDELDALRITIKELKAKVNEETRLKENERKLVESERKTNDSTKLNAKKNLQFISNKYSLNAKWHSGQVDVLKAEISRLKDSIFSPPSSSARLCRPCIFCGTAEASMVFLPCRHEVLCSSCGKDYEDIGNERCPTCNVRIEETVFIFGLASS